MPLRDTQDVLIVETPTASGHLRVSQDVLIIETSVTGTGHIRDTQDVLIFEVEAPITMISYPITPPAISGIGPKDIVMRLVAVVAETESPFTLSQQEQQWPGDRFEVDVNMPPLLLAQGEAWVSFLNQLFGKLGTCLFPDYARLIPQGGMAGTPLVNGTNFNGTNTLNIRGVPSGLAVWAKAGDYVQVTASGGAPQRMYKVLQDAPSDGSGHVALQIRPNIRETLTDGLTIVTSNCAGTFRLAANPTEWKIDQDYVYDISFKLKEAI